MHGFLEYSNSNLAFFLFWSTNDYSKIFTDLLRIFPWYKGYISVEQNVRHDPESVAHVRLTFKEFFQEADAAVGRCSSQ